MQPAALPPTFPVSDTRPTQPTAHLDHVKHAPQHADIRPFSRDTRPSIASGLDDNSLSDSTRTPPGGSTQPNGVHVNGQLSPQSAIAGKKRLANGEVKIAGSEASSLTNTGHSRNTSTASNASNSTIVEVGRSRSAQRLTTDLVQLSQQLRTRLTYAMIKVQNGWQHRSLDEVESLASASPRSTTFNHYSDNAHLLSPRAVLTAQLARHNSDSSSNSDSQPPPRRDPILMSPPSSRKALAPPANIISRATQQQRRRPTPNVQVQIVSQSASRPTVKHRTPSQNAAMEADAVETLLFMASPNHSGSAHQSSQFSPVTSAPSVRHFPSQTSPLRNTFSAPTSPKRVAFAAESEYSARYGRDKNAIVASMVEKLGEDGDADLDEALRLMDQHHATKVAT